MKTLKDLSNMLDRLANNIDNNVIEAERTTSQQVYQDVIENAPTGSTGNYINSIVIEEPTYNDSEISTFIGSSLNVGPTKWTGGIWYNLGYLLEHGTFEHAIPNAFDKGFYYGYVDENGRFHKGTLDKDWHPGTLSQPHYAIALEKNKKLYKDNIHYAWRDK